MHRELLGQLAKLQARGNGREGIKKEREVGREGEGRVGRREGGGGGRKKEEKKREGREVKMTTVENAESILNTHGVSTLC